LIYEEKTDSDGPGPASPMSDNGQSSRAESADVTGFGAWQVRDQGSVLQMPVRRGNFSLNKPAIWWMLAWCDLTGSISSTNNCPRPAAPE
jgi:hypothetical protein